METIQTLRHQIDQADELISVVRTMKGMAAVHRRQYEKAVEGLRAYSETVEQVMQLLLRERPQAVEIYGRREDSPLDLLIVIGSDQGMVGQFNRNLLEHLYRTVDTGPDLLVFVAGRQISQAVAADPIGLTESFPLPRSVDGIPRTAQDILLEVEQARRERQIGSILLFHNSPRGSASYESTHREILPLSAEWMRKLVQRDWPTNNIPFRREDWDELFFRTVQQRIHLDILQGLGESLAAENASRMAAMQSAESNIEDRLDSLQDRYHRRRQQAITEELLDVISGFEATQS